MKKIRGYKSAFDMKALVLIGFMSIFVFLFLDFISANYDSDLKNLISQTIENPTNDTSMAPPEDDQLYQEIVRQSSSVSEMQKEVESAIEESEKTGKPVNEILEEKDINFDKGINAQTDYSKSDEIEKKEDTKKESTKIPENRKISEEKKKISFWKKFLDYLKRITGNSVAFSESMIRASSYDNLELPSKPNSPGDAQEIINPEPRFAKMLKFWTGWTIIGIPEWAYDGDKQEDFIWSTRFTPEAGKLQHFELNLKNNMSRKDSKGREAVNGIIYSVGYYLNEKEGKWKNFSFEGTKVGKTNWLREEGKASLTLNDVTDRDYSIFLAYSCLKFFEQEWTCNEGKWVTFVVETGNTSYHQKIGETPAMGFREIKDLNISDLPSLLKQLNASAFGMQPILHDIFVFSQRTNIEAEVNDVDSLQFYVKNLGNRDLTNLTFELDVGEQQLVDVVYAELPELVKVNGTVQGRVDLLFKQEVKQKITLFIKPKQEEVDTSDNVVIFNISIKSPILPSDVAHQQGEDYERRISYAKREPYVYKQFSEQSQLYIISGTDKVRTIFGGYYKGKSINPTMQVDFRPKIVQEALTSKPFINSIMIGGNMLTGDREVVKYRLKITNANTGKQYETPEMESMYKYYYNPKELIPDLEMCADYTAETIVLSDNKETIDVIESNGFNLCNFNKMNLSSGFKAQRLKKLDGEYIVVSGGGYDPKYIEEMWMDYKLSFIDPSNPKNEYQTPLLHNREIAVFKLGEIFKGRYINYGSGETFQTKLQIYNLSIYIKGRDCQKTTNETIYQKKHNYLLDDEKVLCFDDSFYKCGESNNYFDFESNSGDIVGSWKCEDDKWKYTGKNTAVLSEGNQSFSFEWNDWDVNFQLTTSPLVMKDEQFKIYSSLKLETYVGPRYYSDLRPPWTNHIQNVYNIEAPSYMDTNYSRYKTITETDYIYRIRDLNEEKIVYEIKGNGKDLSPSCSSCRTPSISLEDLQSFYKNKPLPNFINGHYYEFSLTIDSPNVNEFAVAKPKRLLYLDGFQVIANNPILRTRFLGLENSPHKFQVVESQGGGNLDSVMIIYFPKNTFVNKTSGRVEIIDTDLRLIKLEDTQIIEPWFDTPSRAGQTYDYIFDRNKPVPLFDRLEMSITPINSSAEKSKKEFNCKIGRYDGVCYRSNTGLQFNYIDEKASVLYRMNLIDNSYTFLKKYRDNPQQYDAVIYDILSEIDNNPPVSFENLKVIEKPELAKAVYTTTFSPFEIKYSSGGECSNYPIGFKSPKEFSPLSLSGVSYIWSAVMKNYSGDYIVNLVDKSSGKIINSTQIYVSMPDWATAPHYFPGSVGPADKFRVWAQQLNFTIGKHYSVEVYSEEKNDDIAYYPSSFVYENDYYNHILNSNPEYTKKISGLNSTIFATGTLGSNYVGDFNDKDRERIIACSKNYTIAFFGKDYTITTPSMKSNYYAEYYMSPEDIDYNARTGARNLYEEILQITFSVNPKRVDKIFEGEQTTREEMQENKWGERSKQLDSNRFYKFSANKYNNIYNYYMGSPRRNLNAFGDNLGIVCYQGSYLQSINSGREIADGYNNRLFIMNCKWGNFDKLQTYELMFMQVFENSTQEYISQIPSETVRDMQDNFIYPVLNNYLKRLPPTPLLNSSFDAYN